MADPRLLDYIKQQLQRGVGREEIKTSLIANGWQAQEVEEALNSSISPDQSVSPEPSPRRFNKTLPVIVAAVVGVLIIGGGVFAYFNYFQSPGKIVQKMTAKLSEIKSLEYSGEIKIEGDTGNLSGSFTGASDIQNLDDPKSLFAVNIKIDALSQGEFAFGLEIRAISKIIYLKLGDAPDLGFLDLSALKDQWLKIDTESLKQQFGVEQKEEKELSPEQIEKLKAAFREAKIFKITQKLDSEEIEGVNTRHYKFAIDKEGVKRLFTEISQIFEGKALTEEALAELNKSFEAVELAEGEIWIGKKDLLPYKISSSLIIKEADKSEASVKVSFTLVLKNFNKPVQIDIPPQATPLEEILGGLLGGLQGLVPDAVFPSSVEPDFDTDTDQDGLPDRLEAVYGTNPEHPDTDGDGFKDGEEIENGYNPNGPGRL